jgi:hypothetical protein
MAAHYGTAIVPARPRKPRDKAKVEVAVQVVERWILAKLRHRRFFTLAELNHAIAGLLDALNRKPSRHLGASRRQLFEQIDQPALEPLPAEPYEYAEWKECRVGIDYHVEIDKHYYSVPHSLLILDDWGPEPMLAEQRRDLLEIVEDRYARASTLLTSQLPVSRWHDVVGEPTLADAILDRIVHHAQRIELRSDSLRKRQRAPA